MEYLEQQQICERTYRDLRRAATYRRRSASLCCPLFGMRGRPKLAVGAGFSALTIRGHPAARFRGMVPPEAWRSSSRWNGAHSVGVSRATRSPNIASHPTPGLRDGR